MGEATSKALAAKLAEFRSRPRKSGAKFNPLGFSSSIPDLTRAIGEQLAAGKPVDIRPQVVEAVHRAADPMRVAVPAESNVYALSRLEAVDDGIVEATFLDQNGREMVKVVPWSELSGARAFHLDGHIFLARTSGPREPRAAGEFNRHIAAELAHEVVHQLRSTGRFTGAEWDRLLGHGRALRLLDGQYSTYLQIVGDPAAKRVDDVTTREVYEIRYARRSNLQEMMDQEEVTHLVEWYVRGQLSDAEIAPVKDLVEQILSGEIGAREPGVLEEGQPMFVVPP